MSTLTKVKFKAPRPTKYGRCALSGEPMDRDGRCSYGRKHEMRCILREGSKEKQA